jgi:hypothetical protein
MAVGAKQKTTGAGHSKHWLDYHAKWPNRWALAVAKLDLRGAEARVLIYVVGRTWGEYDARRRRFGRTCAKLSSSEIGRAIGMDDSSVRRARASLIKRGALLQFRPHAGRRATSIGPGPLLPALTSDHDKDDAQTQTIDEALATLSPTLRKAADRGRTIIEMAEA